MCSSDLPARNADELDFSNHLLPRRLMEAALDLVDVRCLSFGSALESLEASRSNPYLASKHALGRWMAAAGVPSRLCHLRLHTLYGGAPKAHMFMGQVAAALDAGRPFAMSEGRQLREYHHVDDVAGSVARLLGRSWEQTSLELNSGQPVTLRALAEAVFSAFGRSDLLRVGEIPAAAGENRDRVFHRSPDWLLLPSREPIAGVVAWLRAGHIRTGL